VTQTSLEKQQMYKELYTVRNAWTTLTAQMFMQPCLSRGLIFMLHRNDVAYKLLYILYDTIHASNKLTSGQLTGLINSPVKWQDETLVGKRDP
jgi:hypothetical protein